MSIIDVSITATEKNNYYNLMVEKTRASSKSHLKKSNAIDTNIIATQTGSKCLFQSFINTC